MSKYEVRAGYYAWIIYKNGKEIYAIDDSYGSLAERVTADENGNLISPAELRDLCTDYLDAAREEARDDDKPEPFTSAEQTEIARELFTAWARHFCYDESEIGEWSGSAVTNRAIVEDGNGKIHIFTKILDERESWTFDAFQHEVQEHATELGGVVLAIYRERDIVERCAL